MDLFKKKNDNEAAAPEQTPAETAKPFRAKPAAPFRPVVLYRELVNLISLNFLFLVSCLPVVTIPAAVTAMSRITGTIVQDQNYFLWQDYRKTFCAKFGKALLGGLVFGLATVFLGLAGVVYYIMLGKGVVFAVILAFTACLLIIVYMTSTYYWTTLAFTDLPFKALLKSSLSMVFGCWKRTLRALVIVIVHLFFAVGLAPIGLGTTTVLTDIWAFAFFLILFSANSLLLSYAIWPAVYETVVKPLAEENVPEEEAAKEETVTEGGSEIQSASAENLTWEDDDK